MARKELDYRRGIYATKNNMLIEVACEVKLLPVWMHVMAEPRG